jgi:predicted ester cyclase
MAKGAARRTAAQATGTHEGEFMVMPPTGKRFDLKLIDIVRFGDDDLAREHRGVFDAFAMMQQLGVVSDFGPQ